jgi:magnesium chelatase family protein
VQAPTGGRHKQGIAKLATCGNVLPGPLFDRLDLHLRVKATEVTAPLNSRHVEDSSAIVRLRVARAREKQLKRQGGLNSALSARALRAPRPAMSGREDRCGGEPVGGHRASGRAPIADLTGAKDVIVHHVSEVLLLRQLDGEGLDSAARAAAYGRAHVERPGIY